MNCSHNKPLPQESALTDRLNLIYNISARSVSKYQNKITLECMPFCNKNQQDLWDGQTTQWPWTKSPVLVHLFSLRVTWFNGSSHSTHSTVSLTNNVKYLPWTCVNAWLKPTGIHWINSWPFQWINTWSRLGGLTKAQYDMLIQPNRNNINTYIAASLKATTWAQACLDSQIDVLSAFSVA